MHGLMTIIGLWKEAKGEPRAFSVAEKKFTVLTASSKVLTVSLSIHALLPYVDSGFSRIQHLSKQDKAQIQDFCNWCEENPEASTRSAPDSPIMGVVKGSGDAATQGPSASREVKEDAPREEKSAPSLNNAEGASPSATAAATAGEAGGSGSSGTRIIPFQSLPSSFQEELGKDLFDDPLLTPKNMRKLQDYMKWSFKFT